jgi:hypothetical protein
LKNSFPNESKNPQNEGKKSQTRQKSYKIIPRIAMQTPEIVQMQKIQTIQIPFYTPYQGLMSLNHGNFQLAVLTL